MGTAVVHRFQRRISQDTAEREERLLREQRVRVVCGFCGRVVARSVSPLEAKRRHRAHLAEHHPDVRVTTRRHHVGAVVVARRRETIEVEEEA